MPNIEEFNAGSGQISIPDRGAEAFAQAGRRAGIAYREIGEDIDRTVRPIGQEVIQHQTDMDVSNTYAAFSQAKANGLDAWSKAAADPNAPDNPQIGDNFLTNYKGALQDIADHATTQQGKIIAARMAAQYAGEMHERVSADLGDLAFAKWSANDDAFLGNTVTSVVDDPSKLVGEIGSYREYVENSMPSNVPPALRARGIEEREHNGLARITLAAYKSALSKGEDQIANGQPGTALDGVTQMANAETGWAYLPEEFKASWQSEVDQARARGEERQRQRTNDVLEGVKREGAAVYSQLDTAISNLGTDQQSMSIEQLMQARTAYASKYGLSNPGEVHALNDAIDRARQLQADQKLNTGDGGRTFAALQDRLAIAPGQQGYIGDAELAADWKANKLSTEEYRMAHEFRDKAAQDPGMKLGLEQLKAWQTHMLGGLVQPGGAQYGRGPASAAFVHDSTFTFNAIIRSGKTPQEAIEMMTNENGPMGKAWVNNFQFYQNAAKRHDALGYLQSANGAYYRAQGIAPAEGSAAAPVFPTAQQAGAPAAPRISQDAVDKMF